MVENTFDEIHSAQGTPGGKEYMHLCEYAHIFLEESFGSVPKEQLWDILKRKKCEHKIVFNYSNNL